jgi:hypothetical protein
MAGSDHTVRLEAVLADLEHGRVSTAGAAAAVRGLRFPPAARKSPGQLMRDATEDDMPDRPEPGTAREIARAFHARRITFAQYEVLAQAADEGDRSAGHGSSDAGPPAP